MRAIGLTAAALVLALAIGIAARGGNERDAMAHSCTDSDRRFIAAASTEMTTVGIWTAGYQSGDVDAEVLAGQARDAADRMLVAEPRDGSLREAQRLMRAMFDEYRHALLLAAKGKDAGERMYRAYSLATFARDVLEEAGPELAKRGCDVAPLL